MRVALTVALLGVVGCYEVHSEEGDGNTAWRINRLTGQVCHFAYYPLTNEQLNNEFEAGLADNRDLTDADKNTARLKFWEIFDRERRRRIGVGRPTAAVLEAKCAGSPWRDRGWIESDGPK